jgi:hypothetical protein
MRRHALLRPSIGLTFSLLAATAATGAAVAAGPPSKAHAVSAPVPTEQLLSGRRVCYYAWQQSVGNPEGRLVSFIANYKKDGKCPYVDRLKVTLPRDIGAWMPSPDAWEFQPAPKMTCEQLQATLTLPSSGNGGDPCNYMYNDHLYAVTSYLDTDTANTNRMFDLGIISSFG